MNRLHIEISISTGKIARRHISNTLKENEERILQ